MPRVKIEHIVSFSSEDPEHPARSLLAGSAGLGRWVCLPPAPRCSVLLQLERAVQISAIHIGGYHTAFVEVLVGRSEAPDEPFEVAVPSSALMDAADSRRGERPERVRSFSGDQLAAAARRPHDRVRLVCSQPYDKRAKYGLSFVHIFEPESGRPVAAPAPAAPAFRAESSDEEDFRPGELFAARHTCEAAPPLPVGASPAPASPATAPSARAPSEIARPVVARAGASASAAAPRDRASPAPEVAARDRRRRTTERGNSEGRRRPLAGVVFALSGYQNPRRAALRDTALALGAAYRRDVGPDCTHLVCAFPNTPKLRALRAAGATVRAVRGEWLERCRDSGRRLPWRPDATEPHLRGGDGDGDGDGDPGDGDDDDTDDEIARVAAAAAPDDRPADPDDPAPGAADEPDDPGAASDATLPGAPDPGPPPPLKALPAPFRGEVFSLRGLAPERARLLRRYVLAYGGRVAEEGEAAEPHHRLVDEAAEGGAGLAVRAAWVWRCHRLRRRCSPAPYALR